MSLIVSANSGGKDFAIHPAGVTAARCTRIIDLGTVDDEFKGVAKKSHKIAFGFESATVMPDDEGDFAGKPFLVTTQYTASLGEKANLRKDLESWRGRKFTKPELDGFDMKNVLGKACLLNIVHSDPNAQGRIYANIGGIMPLPAGMVMPAAVGELIFFSLGLDEFDQTSYDKLTDYWKGRIAESDEYKAFFPKGKPAVKPAPVKQPVAAGIDDDDIPF